MQTPLLENSMRQPSSATWGEKIVVVIAVLFFALMAVVFLYAYKAVF
jgi:hypothetical protein